MKVFWKRTTILKDISIAVARETGGRLNVTLETSTVSKSGEETMSSLMVTLMGSMLQCQIRLKIRQEQQGNYRKCLKIWLNCFNLVIKLKVNELLLMDGQSELEIESNVQPQILYIYIWY